MDISAAPERLPEACFKSHACFWRSFRCLDVLFWESEERLTVHSDSVWTIRWTVSRAEWLVGLRDASKVITIVAAKTRDLQFKPL